MGQGNRGWFLTTVAVLVVLIAVSNFLKPVLASSQTGFVFLGTRLSGLWNDTLGPVFGVSLAGLCDHDLAHAVVGASDGVGVRGLRRREHGAVRDAHYRPATGAISSRDSSTRSRCPDWSGSCAHAPARGPCLTRDS